MLDAKDTCFNMDKVEPDLRYALTDNVLPKFTKSKIETDDPDVKRENREILEPTRAKLRSDRVEPKLSHLRIERVSPKSVL
jgi:hypothetical protein